MPVFDYMGSTGLCQVDRPESSMGKFGPQRRKGGGFPGKWGVLPSAASKFTGKWEIFQICNIFVNKNPGIFFAPPL